MNKEQLREQWNEFARKNVYFDGMSNVYEEGVADFWLSKIETRDKTIMEEIKKLKKEDIFLYKDEYIGYNNALSDILQIIKKCGIPTITKKRKL